MPENRPENPEQYRHLTGPEDLRSYFPARKTLSDAPIKIAPSILSADFAHLERQVREAEEGGAAVLHIDVMDGHFVPNITIGPVVVKSLRKVTDLPLDVHLMIQNPHQYIASFIEAGADMISFHIEAMPDAEGLIDDLNSVGVGAGLALNPDTPLSSIEPYLPKLDYLLLMSVFPGFAGQSFIPETMGRLVELREMIDRVTDESARITPGEGNDATKRIELEIDGGIGARNIAEITESGATMIVAGSAIFPDDAATKCKELKRLADEGHSRRL